MARHHIILLVMAVTAANALAQFDDDFGSPLPPRPNIPGAIPLDGPRRPAFRAQPRRFPASLVNDPAPAPVKVRRPAGARQGRINSLQASPAAPLQPLQPAVQPQQAYERQHLEEQRPIQPRPVVEEPEDHRPAEQSLDAFPDPTPSALLTPQQSILPKQPAVFRPSRPPGGGGGAAFRPERPAFIPTPSPDIDFPVPSRQQYRTTVPPPPAQPQFTRQQEQQSYNRAQQVVRTQPQKQQFTKPQYNTEREHPAPRERKPVAQVLRRYREDNEDGSITWGFENDDGSFKEETIGIDCVTRGKYGYIDPDGLKREYSYSSGIPCDKTRDNQEAATNEGYIDYQNNRYVMANGDAIDLDKMVKNRARKPVYRN